jgi:hypothetical protein
VTFSLCFQGQSVVWIVNFVIVAEIIEGFFHWSPVGYFHFAVFETLIALIIFSHVRAACSDPGSVEQKTVRSPNLIV